MRRHGFYLMPSPRCATASWVVSSTERVHGSPKRASSRSLSRYLFGNLDSSETICGWLFKEGGLWGFLDDRLVLDADFILIEHCAHRTLVASKSNACQRGSIGSPRSHSPVMRAVAWLRAVVSLLFIAA